MDKEGGWDAEKQRAMTEQLWGEHRHTFYKFNLLLITSIKKSNLLLIY